MDGWMDEWDVVLAGVVDDDDDASLLRGSRR